MHTFLFYFCVSRIFTAELDLQLIKLTEEYIEKSKYNVYIGPEHLNHFCMFLVTYNDIHKKDKRRFFKDILCKYEDSLFTCLKIAFHNDAKEIFLEDIVYESIQLYTRNDLGVYSACSKKAYYKGSEEITGKSMISTGCKPKTFLEYYSSTCITENDVLYVAQALNTIVTKFDDKGIRYAAIKFTNLETSKYHDLYETYKNFLYKIPTSKEVFKICVFYKGANAQPQKVKGTRRSGICAINIYDKTTFNKYKVFSPKLSVSKSTLKITSPNESSYTDCETEYVSIYKIQIFFGDIEKYRISIRSSRFVKDPNGLVYKLAILGCALSGEVNQLLETAISYTYDSTRNVIVKNYGKGINFAVINKFLSSYKDMLGHELMYDTSITNLDAYFLSNLDTFYLLCTQAHIYEFNSHVGLIQEEVCKKVAQYLLKSENYTTIEAVDYKKLIPDAKALSGKKYGSIFSINKHELGDSEVLNEHNVNRIDWNGKILILEDIEGWMYYLIFAESEKLIPCLMSFINISNEEYAKCFNDKIYDKEKYKAPETEVLQFTAKLIVYKAMQIDILVLLLYNYLDLESYLKEIVYNTIVKIILPEILCNFCAFLLKVRRLSYNHFCNALKLSDTLEGSEKEDNVANVKQFGLLMHECKNELKSRYELFKKSKHYSTAEISIIIYYVSNSHYLPSKVQELVGSLNNFAIEDEKDIKTLKTVDEKRPIVEEPFLRKRLKK